MISILDTDNDIHNKIIHDLDLYSSFREMVNRIYKNDLKYREDRNIDINKIEWTFTVPSPNQ